MAPTGRRDRHLIIVQNNDQAPVHRASIIHGLVGHAGGDCAVANHADHIVLLTGEVAGDRHSQSGRDRSRRVRSAKAVVFAFRALGETGQTAACTQRPDAVSAAGEDFMRIGLMADVPDKFVIRGVKDVMQGHC